MMVVKKVKVPKCLTNCPDNTPLSIYNNETCEIDKFLHVMH